ncbi:WXG100 family type VII secretion target [uncultured Tessaracoccus sp.]|uniref:WXG100 family type VII secretion target n=1 Tax=uncultured Tessaracoccus sp. TaxID=905023 RepID=UPI0025F21161|nr:WXG100 family type VII secretion target [uncultured Tessaracoccus sp.]
MDYKVDWSALRSAGQQMEQLAETAEAAMETMRLDAVAPALPGSMSGGKAMSLDEEWTRSATKLHQQLASHAEGLIHTADEYERREQQAQQLAESFFGGAW